MSGREREIGERDQHSACAQGRAAVSATQRPADARSRAISLPPSCILLAGRTSVAANSAAEAYLHAPSTSKARTPESETSLDAGQTELEASA